MRTRTQIRLTRLVAAAGLLAASATPALADSDSDSPRPEVGYKKGFFVASGDGNFKLVTQGRVQGRFEFESAEEGETRVEENAFSIARARLTLKGNAFTEDIKFKFQSDFGKGNVVLKDFYVDWKVSEQAVVRVGQYKRPFSRQQVSSSGRLELVDRAIIDKAFATGRDIGVMVHNNYEKSPDLEWAVGVFNGTGDKPVFSGGADPMTGEVDGKFTNVPGEVQPALVARVGINSGGIKGYSEADLEGGPLRFAVAGSLLAAFDNDSDNTSVVQAGVDGMVKQDGLSVGGGVHISTVQDGEGFSDQSYEQLGARAQAGYMLDDKMQPAVRYAVVLPDADDADAMHELTGGFSLYEFKHGFKWQTDIGARFSGGDNTVLARTQLQLSF